MWLQKIYSTSIDFLFPRFCVGCKKEGRECCDECFKKIRLLAECHCSGCGQKSEDAISGTFFCSTKCCEGKSFDGVIGAAEFHEGSVLAHLIHRFKYDGAREISKTFLELMKNSSAVNDFFAENKNENFAVIPVPLHPQRLRWRGFNQSSLLAQGIVQAWGGRFENSLVRLRPTKPQVELSRGERIENVRGAFGKMPGATFDSDTTYLLVDDVCTTGSTLHECAKILKENGATKVIGMVVGRAV